MNPDRERLVLQHLESALEWPPGERDALLERELAHDPTLLSDVRELLAMSENVDVSMPTQLPMAQVPDEDTPPPERLGPYRLRELLGSGGMGRVYRAERADGLFEHSIAIKLMRRTRLPAQVAAQFARERQILARFHHPNIAQLFDGGLTPDGHSYFVMELIDGRPISEFSADEKLGLRALLLLFRQVCSAVQYAHAHLVVHADLKPTNIMVTKEGTAKLLDFGVARVLQQAGEAAAAETTSLGITVYYASPARRKGEPPTVVDDVYSLGVLLKDLLKRIDAVPADLRSIANQASADDPLVRYGSVDALRTDIDRWLDGLAVRAHGTNWTYVASKYFARHRFGVTAAATSVVLLAAAAVALGVLYVREQRATERAERRFAQVSELSRYVLFDVYDTLESIPRALTLRRDLAQKGQQYLDQLSQDSGAPLDVRLDVIEGLRRLALVQGDPSNPSLQQVPMARTNLDRAEELARALSTEGVEGRERRLALARIAISRARILVGMNLDLKDASRVLDEGEAQLEPLMRANDPAAVPLKLDLASERAIALQWDGKYAESIDVTREAMQIPDADLNGPPEKRRAALRRRIRLLDIFAEGHYYTDEIEASVAPYREALESVRQLAKEEPLSLTAMRLLSRSEWALASVLVELDPPQAEEAERLLAAALERSKEIRLLEPANKEAIRMESVFASTYAQTLAALGRLDEAESRLKDVARTRLDLWQASPENWGIARDYVIAIWALADTQIRMRATGRACGSYATAVDMLERMRKAARLTKLDEETTLRPIQEKVAQHCKGRSPGTTG